ncbi:L-seryl-tRNA(Sec) selenium transferase [Bacillus piscicola]|uniref:L-seryl-tRNA(Sec) selenium transferase n=1 Tax=Bacillus piscicola TaxID=1632684 RepID=UPI001F093E31|nr:L-seryl-tRNA(Sec) selenium transferase [Bacillus piscicola]
MKEYLRELPAVHQLQKDARFSRAVEESGVPRERMTKWLQEEITLLREEIVNGSVPQEDMKKPLLCDKVISRLRAKATDFALYRVKRVINATGTILHTNLGRAKLSEEAINQVVLAAKHYTNLEYDVERGERGSRHDLIESTIREITGAEAAMVVNNNAAAVYLVLRALAKDKEVIVSRGELVEIGGSFRVSAIMEESGARLVEVGTTNKTHLSDYEQAVSEETALFMKVHTSNFKTIGFTASVSAQELAVLSSSYSGTSVYEDLGSGAFYDFAAAGIGDEPTVAGVLQSGVDIVSFSGDKLLGGPQAGIIAGKKELIQKLKKHQLARVLRVDKMTLAALEATLKAFLQEKHETIPAVRDVLAPAVAVKEKATAFCSLLTKETEDWQAELREDTSQIGGGTMPGVAIPTYTAVLKHKILPAHQAAGLLRAHSPVVVTRLQEEKLVLDFRTVTEEEIPLLVQRLLEVTLS